MGKLSHQAEGKPSPSQVFLPQAEGLAVSLDLSSGSCYFCLQFCIKRLFKGNSLWKGGETGNTERLTCPRGCSILKQVAVEMAPSYKKEFDFVSHVKKLNMVSYPCNPSTGRQGQLNLWTLLARDSVRDCVWRVGGI